MTLLWGTTEHYPNRCHSVLPGTRYSMCTLDTRTKLVMDSITEHRSAQVRVCPECAIAAVNYLFEAWPSPRPRPAAPAPRTPHEQAAPDWFETTQAGLLPVHQ